MMLKIDTNAHIGDEGQLVRRNGRIVGIMTPEQYGSHILVLGVVNKVKGLDGMYVVKTMAELGNKEKVELTIDIGSRLEIQLGEHPVIYGVVQDLMRVGCGGACCGLFARSQAPLIDEAIILDHHITGLFTKHPAGAEQKPYCGLTPVGRLATNGRYFFEHGDGWGGINIKNPIEAIKEIDMNIAKPGMKILVAETNWRKIALFEVSKDGKPVPVAMTSELEVLRKMAAGCCEESRV